MSAKRKSPPSKLSEAEGGLDPSGGGGGGAELPSDGPESPVPGLSPRPELPGAGDELQAQRRSMESVLGRLSSRLLDEASTPVTSA